MHLDVQMFVVMKTSKHHQYLNLLNKNVGGNSRAEAQKSWSHSRQQWNNKKGIADQAWIEDVRWIW